MDPARFERLRRIVLDALSLPEAERAAYLERVCVGDDALRQEAGSLLHHSGKGPALARTGALDGLVEQAFEDGRRAAPDRIGTYRILDVLGEGGMGVVYRAEQIGPIRRQVALKLIRTGFDSASIVARFESERQALARMSHPNIARVYDAGTTESGLPYFAMELVDGPRLTRYCDDEVLDPERRLKLFLDVCDGVQHAHRRGVIHRDLKPSNVLVEPSDGVGVPKIIDFGVAKAIDRPLTGRSVATVRGLVVGTPEYMSPEQAAGSADVDTRTDVYALGVILYELLAGMHPLPSEVLDSGDFDEIRRRIRDEEPSKPSTRVTGAGDSGSETARRRGTDPASLARRLRGDLDWITLKALEKDPARRYGSPDELAADIRRHLGHEPVAAGPPGALYRLRKLARRRRGLLAAAAAVLVVLVAGAVGTVTGLVRARRQAEITREVNAFLNNDLLAAATPERGGKDFTVLEALDAAAAKIEGRFSGDPRIEAEIRKTLGNTYRTLGRYDEAHAQLSRAIELLRRLEGDDHPDTLDARQGLAMVLYNLRREPEAGAILREVVEAKRRVLGREHPSTLSSQGSLAMVLRAAGRTEEATALASETAEAQRRVLGADSEPLRGTLRLLASLYTDERRYDQAEKILDEIVEDSTARYGPEHRRTLVAKQRLAELYSEMGRKDDAIALYVELLDANRKLLGPEHPETLFVAMALAANYHESNRFDLARPLYEETLATQRRVLGADHPDTVTTLSNLAVLFAQQGLLDRAEPRFREILDVRRRTQGEEHPQTLAAENNLATLLLDRGKPQEAVPVLEHVLEVKRRLAGDSEGTLSAMAQLASVYFESGRPDDAAALYEDVLARRRTSLGDEHESTRSVLHSLAVVRQSQERFDEADALLRELVELTRRAKGEAGEDTGHAIWNLARVCAARGDAVGTRRHLDEAMSILRPHFEDQPENLSYLEGRYHALLGENDTALECLEKAVAAGFLRYRSLVNQDDFDGLRDDPRFEALLTEIRDRNSAP